MRFGPPSQTFADKKEDYNCALKKTTQDYEKKYTLTIIIIRINQIHTVMYFNTHKLKCFSCLRIKIL